MSFIRKCSVAKFLLSTPQITRNYAHIRNVFHVSQAWLWKVLRKLISQRIARLRTIRNKEDFSKAFSHHEFQFIFHIWKLITSDYETVYSHPFHTSI